MSPAIQSHAEQVYRAAETLVVLLVREGASEDTLPLAIAARDLLEMVLDRVTLPQLVRER